MNDDQPLAFDQIIEIDKWIERIKDSHDDESLSFGETLQLDTIYGIIKAFNEELTQ